MTMPQTLPSNGHVRTQSSGDAHPSREVARRGRTECAEVAADQVLDAVVHGIFDRGRPPLGPDTAG